MQKTAYEMRISDWSSDVCSSDLCCSQSSASADSLRSSEMFFVLVNANVQSKSKWVTHLSIFKPATRMVWMVRALSWRETRMSQIGRASCRERVWKYV